MSKIICVLSTHNSDNKEVLLKRLAELVKENKHKKSSTFKVLLPIKDDPFFAANSLVFPEIFSVIKVTVPKGISVSIYGDELVSRIKILLKGLDVKSQLCVASERVFKKTDTESVNYMYFMKRRDGFSGADYLDYYSNSHFRFGMETKGITYIQNYIDKEATTDLAEQIGIQGASFDSVSEMLFSSIETFFYDNEVGDLGDQAEEDERKFIDRDMSFMICLRELTA